MNSREYQGRPSREWLHMKTALLWARRSLCSQKDRQVGAVITTANLRQVLSIGYNGPARGLPDMHCWSHAKKGEHDSNCDCLHAEENAILGVDSTIPDKVIFVTLEPCYMCAQRIAQANITKCFYHDEYRNHNGIELLKKLGVIVDRVVCR